VLQERPALSVLLPVVHPVVDQTGRLHTSLLNNWIYGGSRLSSAVAEAVAALTEGVVDNRQGGELQAVHPPPIHCVNCLIGIWQSPRNTLQH
jgi:hypothetical protein